MLEKVIIYFLEIFLTNILFSFLLGLSIIRFNKKNLCSNLEIFLYSLGLGPVITSLLLYYLFLIIPGKSSIFYIIFILIFYLIIFLVGKSSIKKIIGELKKIKINSVRKKIVLFFSIFLFLSILIIWSYSIIRIPILGHDILTYGSQAKVFYDTKTIEYKTFIFDSKSNFFYLGSHGYSYILLGTWEKMLDGVFRINKDFYFRSITGYYWLLIVALELFWLYKKRKNWAFGTLVLILIPGFFLMSADYHIDTFRIFFLIVSLIFLLYSVNKFNYFYLTLFGIFGGLMVNAHTIGVIALAIYVLAFFIFSNGSFIKRIKRSSIILVLALVFGGIHYYLDIFYGTGWIFVHSISFLVNVNNNFSPSEAYLRGIDTQYKLIFNGYLGHFFRFDYMGPVNWIFFPIVIFFVITFKKRKKWERALFFVYIVSQVIISYKGYFNFRYLITFLPVTIFIIYYYLNDLLIFLKLEKIKNYSAIILLLFVLVGDLYYLSGYINRSKKFIAIDSSVKDNRQTSMFKMVNYINNLSLPQNKKILVNYLPFFYYYTNKVGVYYVFNEIFTNDGKKQLSSGNNMEVLTNTLVKKLNVEYILSSFSSNKQDKLLSRYVEKNAEKVFESGDYILYKIKY